MADPAPAQAPTPTIDEKHARFRLRVSPSAIHRWGIFAEERIPKGRKIIEYTGEKINRRETKRRSDGPLNYLFTLDPYWTIDGSVNGSGAQYINHCCEPNCHAYILKGHILYMSSREIRKGEELTIDYRFEPDVEKVPCHCGAAKCRGAINLPKPKKARARAVKKAPAAKKAAVRKTGTTGNAKKRPVQS